MKRFLHASALASLLLLAACAGTAPKPEPATAAAGSAADDGLSQEDRIAFFVNNARNGELDAVRQGLDAGLPIDARDSLDQTALIAAISHNALDIVQLLLAHGADPNLPDNAGWTPLHYAAYFGSGTELLGALLGRGAKIDARNDRGLTPLYLASGSGHTVQVKLLLERGADRSIASQAGYTPLRIAKIKGLDAIVALLDTQSGKAAAGGAN